MIASWMLYALAIGAVVTLGGLTAERALSANGRPTRFVWSIAMALTALWPIAPTIARLLPTPARGVSVLPFTIVVMAPSVISASEAAAAARAVLIDRLLIGGWIAISLLLVARLLKGVVTLERLRGQWKRGRVNGTRVKLSENIGPAVVGLRSMDVVLPEWILSLDESLREIVLRHEEEHRSARDPYLLFGAAILVALMPWNVALWFQARRLRLAIEMDCDARVLRAHPSPERYGMLILTIAQRRSVAPTLFAPMLSEPTTNLERRILAMRTTKRVARVTAVAGGMITVAMLAFASSLQSAPSGFSTAKLPAAMATAASRIIPLVLPETIPVKKKTAPTKSPVPTGRNEVLRLDSVQVTEKSGMPMPGNAAPRYPGILRAAEIEGTVIARYHTDASGRVDPTSIEILSSTHALFTQSVREALANWRATPNSVLQTPVVFNLTNKSAAEVSPGGLPVGTVVVTATPMDVAPTAAPTASPANAPAGQTYFEFQVAKPVNALPGSPGARYPDLLREAGVEGAVLAQFVVDQYGRPDLSTFKVLKTDHDLFTNAVREALPNMRFTPAEVDGQTVKQLVQMPFHFNLSKDKPPRG